MLACPILPQVPRISGRLGNDVHTEHSTWRYVASGGKTNEQEVNQADSVFALKGNLPVEH